MFPTGHIISGYQPFSGLNHISFHTPEIGPPTTDNTPSASPGRCVMTEN